MKTIAVIILTLVMFSCQDDDNKKAPELSDNTVEAKKNEAEWTGVTEIYLDHNNNDTLTFLGIATEELLGIKIKFEGVGTYTLATGQGYYHTTVGGDVIMSYYRIRGVAGELVISEYDQDEKTIEGSFQLSLRRIRSYTGADADVLHFTNGRFKGKISE